MKRYGSVIGLRPEHAEAYARLHADAWPGVLATLTACGVRNYTIFRYDDLLFSYFEYVGEDYDADMEKMAADPVTQEWWKVCTPMQQPVGTAGPDEWWKQLPELFHLD